MVQNTTSQNSDNAPKRKKQLVVHTMKSDAARPSSKKEPSVLVVVPKTTPSKQQEPLVPAPKIQTEQVPIPKKRGKERKDIPLFLFSFSILITLSVLSALLYFLLTKISTPVIEQNIPRSFVTADEQTIIVLNNENQSVTEQILHFQQESFSPETLRYLPIKLERAGEKPSYARAGEFFPLVSLAPPSGLVSTLSDRWNLYLYYGEDAKDIVLVFETRDYSRAVADLFSWEKTFPAQILQLVGTSADGIFSFRDKVAENIDLRLAVNPNIARTPSYTIFSGRLIVIATSEPAMRNMLKRMIAGPLHL